VGQESTQTVAPWVEFWCKPRAFTFHQAKQDEQQTIRMKTTFAMAVLGCLVLALSPTNAGAPSRQLRVEDDATESPLKAFQVAIKKFEKHEDARQLAGEDDAKETIKTFVTAMLKLKQKSEGARRTEEENADIQVDGHK